MLLEKLPGGTFAIYTQQPESPGGLYSGRANGASSYQVPDHAGHVRHLTDANGAITPAPVTTRTEWRPRLRPTVKPHMPVNRRHEASLQ